MAEETTEATQALTTSTPETPAKATTPDMEQPDTSVAAHAAEPDAAIEPDEIQPFIDKAHESIQHEVDADELGKFLRTHIKTFREEWDVWSDRAKDAYVFMMTSQLVQRKAAATQIGIGNEFKLPVPSAQTQLFESIKQTQVKPQKHQPVLLMPPNLRPTYSLKR